MAVATRDTPTLNSSISCIMCYKREKQGRGNEVLVSIFELVPARDIEALRRAAGAWKGLADADALIANIYADRLVTARP
jgi:hypothetical protein